MNISDPGFQPATGLMLPENEVQLCRLNLETLVAGEDRWQQLLSADEQTRARRYLSPLVRQRFVATRGVLRIVLGAYLVADPKKLIFRHTPREKPSLGPPYADSGVTFNVSHSSGVALLAFSRRRELGVDVERIHRDLDVNAIARQFFSLHEQRQLAAVNAEEKYEAFFRCWTRKEAYIKATGEGLSLPLEQFDVCLTAEDNDALLSTRPDGSEAAHWSLREVPAGAGYVAALCVAGHDWHLRSWEP